MRLSIAALDGDLFMKFPINAIPQVPGVAALGVPADDRIAGAIFSRVELALAVLAGPSPFEDFTVGTDQEVVADVGEAATDDMQLVPEAHSCSRVLHTVGTGRVVNDDLAERRPPHDVVVAYRLVGTPLRTRDDGRSGDPTNIALARGLGVVRRGCRLGFGNAGVERTADRHGCRTGSRQS